MNIFQYILNVYKSKNLTFRLIFILIYSGSTVDYSGVCYLFWRYSFNLEESTLEKFWTYIFLTN